MATGMTTPLFSVGSIPVHGDLILSPMDGYSDLPFRALCRELGSAMSYTEFINALDILQGHPHVHEKYTFLPGERPMVFQILSWVPRMGWSMCLVLCWALPQPQMMLALF